jgi:hypothetical protein
MSVLRSVIRNGSDPVVAIGVGRYEVGRTNSPGLCLPCAARKRRIPLPVDALSSPIAAFPEGRGMPQLVIRVR